MYFCYALFWPKGMETFVFHQKKYSSQYMRDFLILFYFRFYVFTLCISYFYFYFAKIFIYVFILLFNFFFKVQRRTLILLKKDITCLMVISCLTCFNITCFLENKFGY